jgi:hypothetical protein
MVAVVAAAVGVESVACPPYQRLPATCLTQWWWVTDFCWSCLAGRKLLLPDSPNPQMHKHTQVVGSCLVHLQPDQPPVWASVCPGKLEVSRTQRHKHTGVMLGISHCMHDSKAWQVYACHGSFASRLAPERSGFISARTCSLPVQASAEANTLPESAEGSLTV